MKCRSADDSKIFYHIQAKSPLGNRTDIYSLIWDPSICCTTPWDLLYLLGLGRRCVPRNQLECQVSRIFELDDDLGATLRGRKSVFCDNDTLKWIDATDTATTIWHFFIAPECARVLRQGNWGRGYLLVMRSWRYTSTCSKCDGPGSELQSWQDNAIHDVGKHFKCLESFHSCP